MITTEDSTVQTLLTYAIASKKGVTFDFTMHFDIYLCVISDVEKKLKDSPTYLI